MSRAQPPTESAAPAASLGVEPRLLRINEVAAETGLTTRAIRYYEEIGLLAPAARSDGDYRLYDASDLDRLQFIRSLRDDAGFSLAQIGQLLEDDAARERNRERFRQTGDRGERRELLQESRARTAHQIEILETKAARPRTRSARSSRPNPRREAGHDRPRLAPPAAPEGISGDERLSAPQLPA